jgi:hypothetical protein
MASTYASLFQSVNIDIVFAGTKCTDRRLSAICGFNIKRSLTFTESFTSMHMEEFMIVNKLVQLCNGLTYNDWKNKMHDIDFLRYIVELSQYGRHKFLYSYLQALNYQIVKYFFQDICCFRDIDGVFECFHNEKIIDSERFWLQLFVIVICGVDIYSHPWGQIFQYLLNIRQSNRASCIAEFLLLRIPLRLSSIYKFVRLADIDLSDTDEAYTPIPVIRAIRSTFAQRGGLNIDVSSNFYSQRYIKSDIWFSKDVDPLTYEWFGNVYINPPYKKRIFWPLLIRRLMITRVV